MPIKIFKGRAEGMLLRQRKGQSTLEYALLIAAVVAGLLVMQMYVKRGMSGRVKSASDELGEQYDPTAFSANYTTVSHSKRNETLSSGKTTSKLTDEEYTRRNGTESVSSWSANASIYDDL